MKPLDLIRQLRAQAINDHLGTVCCRPRERASGYFDLAIGLVEMNRENQILFATLQALEKGTSNDPPYEVWSRLFDGLEAMVEGRELAPLVEQSALDQGVRAVKRSRPAALEAMLNVLFEDAALWGSAGTRSPSLMKKLIEPLSADLAIAAPGTMNVEGSKACLEAIHGMLARLTNGNSPVLNTVHGLLHSEDEGAESSAASTAFRNIHDPLLVRCRLAALLLEHLDRPEACAGHVQVLFRDACQAQALDSRELGKALEQAQKLFRQLNQKGAFDDLFDFAVHTVFMASAAKSLDRALLDTLLTHHPEPDDLASLCDMLWDHPGVGVRPEAPEGTDDPEWRAALFGLLRASTRSARMEILRPWLFRRLQVLIHGNPARLAPFIEKGVKPSWRHAGSAGDYLIWLSAPPTNGTTAEGS